VKLFTILLPLFIHVNMYIYIYICAVFDCSSYVAIRSGFRVSNRVSDIHGFGFGHEFSPESVFGSVSGFKFGFRFWVPRHSTRSKPDPLPSLAASLPYGPVSACARRRPRSHCWALTAGACSTATLPPPAHFPVIIGSAREEK
jgi:hypothetical protein